MLSKPELISVGDRVTVDGHGTREISRIDVCLRPHVDPAGEDHFANVESVEVGPDCPPVCIVMEGGVWAYGIQIQAVEREEQS